MRLGLPVEDEKDESAGNSVEGGREAITAYLEARLTRPGIMGATPLSRVHRGAAADNS